MTGNTNVLIRVKNIYGAAIDHAYVTLSDCGSKYTGAWPEAGSALFYTVYYGVHTVTVTKTGYADYSGAVTVTASDCDFLVTMTPPNSVITIAVVGTGTTDPAAGAHTYAYGSSVTVTATAGALYHFTKMVRSDGQTVYTNPHTFTSLVTVETVTVTFTADSAPPASDESTSTSTLRMSNPQFKVTVT